jgi:hypothetical protein
MNQYTLENRYNPLEQHNIVRLLSVFVEHTNRSFRNFFLLIYFLLQFFSKLNKKLEISSRIGYTEFVFTQKASDLTVYIKWFQLLLSWFYNEFLWHVLFQWNPISSSSYMSFVYITTFCFHSLSDEQWLHLTSFLYHSSLPRVV